MFMEGLKAFFTINCLSLAIEENAVTVEGDPNLVRQRWLLSWRLVNAARGYAVPKG